MSWEESPEKSQDFGKVPQEVAESWEKSPHPRKVSKTLEKSLLRKPCMVSYY